MWRDLDWGLLRAAYLIVFAIATTVDGVSYWYSSLLDPRKHPLYWGFCAGFVPTLELLNVILFWA